MSLLLLIFGYPRNDIRQDEREEALKVGRPDGHLKQDQRLLLKHIIFMVHGGRLCQKC